eukprot:COSAG01_NODE_13297_length_1605_cov_1.581009_1_plen_194_part_00
MFVLLRDCATAQHTHTCATRVRTRHPHSESTPCLWYSLASHSGHGGQACFARARALTLPAAVPEVGGRQQQSPPLPPPPQQHGSSAHYAPVMHRPFHEPPQRARRRLPAPPHKSRALITRTVEARRWCRQASRKREGGGRDRNCWGLHGIVLLLLLPIMHHQLRAPAAAASVISEADLAAESAALFAAPAEQR